MSMNETKKFTPAETVALAAEEASKIIQLASEQAKKIVYRATETAATTVDKKNYQEEKLGRILSGSLREVFGENEDAKRFVDVSRIPLICKSIFDIHENIKSIREYQEKTDGDHETRLRVIERNMWRWIGVLLIIPPMVTIAIAWVISLITKR